MDQLLGILTEIRPDIDFASAQDLMGSGALDSFDIVAIVGEISSAFGIRVPVEEIKRENFSSAQAMLGMIERLRAED